MKNQYFGDTRDLFKYDLVLELLMKNDFLERFTFIPMLTEDTQNLHGRKVNYDRARAGTQRKVLVKFLAMCIVKNKRNIVELKEFFSSLKLPRKVDFAIYRENECFSHKMRATYFNQIGGQLLSRSVVLVDPDIGLEAKSMGSKEQNYITYTEVELLFNRMDRNSVLVIFQFIPRVERRRMFDRLKKPPPYLA